MIEMSPKSWNRKSKPHYFCPGCGHAIILKQLGYVIDELKRENDVKFFIDIGCSLLAWNFFNVDTVQTHHGRTTPTAVGYKMAQSHDIVLGYMGDGGGYAIGLQSVLHAALRNDPITIILVNNENYAMTGGQMAPTTMDGEVTTTSPAGKEKKFGPGMHGPELIRNIAADNAFIARASISAPEAVKLAIGKAMDNQIHNNAFSFLEILSICPTNWKTNARESFDRLKTAEGYYHIGEIPPQKNTKKNTE
jgi:2-oxoglutarate ferredoxin oxidoreductase subunit beta